MWLQFKRTLKSAISNVTHNIWLALSVTSVIAIALFIINIQLANIVANNLLLADLENKVNVSVYFKEDVSRDKVQEAEKVIKEFPEVERVTLISREETLEKFNKTHSKNKTLQEVVDVLGENPFGDILNIKAYDTDDYAKIAEKIKSAQFNNLIDNVNYEEHQDVIQGLGREIKNSQKFTIVLGVVLSVIAVLVTFNTITITIYTYRRAIEIMKLVGASNLYVTMPFVWEGFLYGSVGAIVAIIASYFYLHFLANGGSSDTLLFLSSSKFIQQFLGEYFTKHIFLAIGFQLFLGIFLGVLSSLIAIRRYLKH